MKAINALFISIMLLISAACGNTEVKENNIEEVAVAAVTPNATSTLDIEGMTCEVGCKGAIEKHMNKTKGVASCVIDFESEVAVIEYDNTTISEEEIISEIGSIADHAYSATPHVETVEEPIEDPEMQSGAE